MINTAYRDKPLVYIGAMFQEKLVCHHQAVNEADSCLLTRRAGSKTVARRKESDFTGRLAGVKLLKTVHYLSARHSNTLINNNVVLRVARR